jgi:hypothetical protein
MARAPRLEAVHKGNPMGEPMVQLEFTPGAADECQPLSRRLQGFGRNVGLVPLFRYDAFSIRPAVAMMSL